MRSLEIPFTCLVSCSSDRKCCVNAGRVAPCRAFCFIVHRDRCGEVRHVKDSDRKESCNIVHGPSCMRIVGVYGNICVYIMIASFRAKGLASRCSRYAVERWCIWKRREDTSYQPPPTCTASPATLSTSLLLVFLPTSLSTALKVV